MSDHDPTGHPPAGGPEMIDSLNSVITRPRSGIAVLGLTGEIDMLTASRFEAAMTELLAGPEATLVVDLTRVTFLASSGLAVLIRAAHRGEERGIRLRLVAASRLVRRPLEVTGADQLFDIHPDADSATGPHD